MTEPLGPSAKSPTTVIESASTLAPSLAEKPPRFGATISTIAPAGAVSCRATGKPGSPRFVKGERVVHPTFGSGSVVEVTG